jgi:hypothetical protein
MNGAIQARLEHFLGALLAGILPSYHRRRLRLQLKQATAFSWLLMSQIGDEQSGFKPLTKVRFREEQTISVRGREGETLLLAAIACIGAPREQASPTI